MVVFLSELEVRDQGWFDCPEIDAPLGINSSQAVMWIQKQAVHELLLLLVVIPPDLLRLEQPHQGDDHLSIVRAGSQVVLPDAQPRYSSDLLLDCILCCLRVSSFFLSVIIMDPNGWMRRGGYYFPDLGLLFTAFIF